jgi:type I restriction enzyme S subunit
MNYLDLSDVAHISIDIHNDMQRTKVKNGDVLLNITGASIGRIAVFWGKNNTANVNQHVCIVRPLNEKVLPEYLSLVISNTSYQNQILGKNAGATRQAFNYTQIKEFEIPLPQIEKQRELVTFLNKYKKMHENFESSEAKMNRLFNSLLQKAFKGELDFRETEEQLMAAEPGSDYETQAFSVR